tara:strand:+ start:360 stop:539 length:180 start_codon:yes stop_codon:yes gene_type:complete
MKDLNERYYIKNGEPKPYSFLDVFTGLEEKKQEDVVTLARLQVDSITQTSVGSYIKRII